MKRCRTFQLLAKRVYTHKENNIHRKYEKAWTNELLIKLLQYSVGRTLYMLIKSYIFNRRARVDTISTKVLHHTVRSILNLSHTRHQWSSVWPIKGHHGYSLRGWAGHMVFSRACYNWQNVECRSTIKMDTWVMRTCEYRKNLYNHFHTFTKAEGWCH